MNEKETVLDRLKKKARPISYFGLNPDRVHEVSIDHLRKLDKAIEPLIEAGKREKGWIYLT